MSDNRFAVAISTVRYIDIDGYKIRTAEFTGNPDRYAAVVVGDGIEEFDDTPVETASESRCIAAAFAVEAYEETK